MDELNTPQDSGKKDTKALKIIIGVLALVILVQGIALFTNHRRVVESTSRNSYVPSHKTTTATPPYRVTASPIVASWRVDPFEEFDAVSRHMSNVMRQVYMMSAPFMHASDSNSGFDFSPAVDLQETENAYVLHSDLPGLDKDKINVTVRNNILTLEGVRETSSETEDSKKGYYAHERSYGAFSRSLTLPGPVDESKISATYKNGVLTITLPKITPTKNQQRVSIQ